MSDTDYKPLDADIIQANLKTHLLGKKVLIYKSTSSTNDVAAEYAKGGTSNNGLVVFAEEQSRGRGRRGNKWFGTAGKSLMFSVLLFDVGLACELLTLAVAVAVAEAVGKCDSNQTAIKWPNDIIIGGKKLGGILMETFGRGVQKGNYILGIGINCNQSKKDFDPSIADGAASIKIRTRRTCDRNKLAAKLINNLEKWIEIATFEEQKVLKMWNLRSRLLGRRVTLECDRKRFTGICVGVDPVEGLILHLERGGVRMFKASHTTILEY